MLLITGYLDHRDLSPSCGYLFLSLLLQSCFLPFNLLFAIFWKTVELYVMSVSEAQVILTCLTDYQRIWLLFSLCILIMWISRLRRVKLKLEGLVKCANYVSALSCKWANNSLIPIMARHWRCPAVTSAYSVILWLLAFFLTMLWFRLFLHSVDSGSFWVHIRRFLLYVARWHFKNWHVLYSTMLNIWKLISCMTFSFSCERLWISRCGRTLSRIRHHFGKLKWLD